jgi:tripartite-type tricarboxylate transporter receptor subunit TctC
MVVLLGCISAPVLPQSYPVKPIRFLVGFPPGGTNDIVARLVAQKVSELIGQSMVVENRGGANTAIATELGSRAPADGYTILLNAPGHATNPALMKLNFDPINDFAFITLIAEAPNLLVVHPSLPAHSVKELIAISKKNPGNINYGSSGTGTTVHLSAELFQHITGVKWVHIPYKGGGPAVIELMAGQTQIYFGNLPTVIGYARAGKLRPLAVTSLKRSVAAPDIPTVDESGVKDLTSLRGMVFRRQRRRRVRSLIASTASSFAPSKRLTCVTSSSRQAPIPQARPPSNTRRSCRAKSPNGTR